MQRDWNKSLSTLLARKAQRPPEFKFVPAVHSKLRIVMSDGSNREKLGKGPLARRTGVTLDEIMMEGADDDGCVAMSGVPKSSNHKQSVGLQRTHDGEGPGHARQGNAEVRLS